jgi:hypothetical protein
MTVASANHERLAIGERGVEERTMAHRLVAGKAQLAAQTIAHRPEASLGFACSGETTA